MVAAAWILVPLAILHLWMWCRRRSLLRFQLLVDLLLAVVVGPALVVGGQLDPVRCLERNRPFGSWQWEGATELQPTQSDLVLQFHPWWAETRRQLLEGRLPTTSTRIGGGLPLLANGQTGLWAPVMLPVWALGPEGGSTVMAAWKLELAALGAFLLLSRPFRLRFPAAALGGIVYGGCASQVAWLLVPLSWVTAALPWLWWGIAAALRGRAGGGAVLLVGVAGGWLGGAGLHPETAAIVLGSTWLAGLVLHPRRWRRVVAAAAVSTVVALALAWPTLGYIGSSARVAAADASDGLAPGVRAAALQQAVVPMAQGHPGRGDWRAPYPYAPAAVAVGGVALALLAAGHPRRRSRALYCAAMASLGIGAVLAYRIPPLGSLLAQVPPLDHMTLPRFAALVPWGLALVAAVSLDGALAGRRLGWPWRLVPVAVIAGVAAAVAPWRLAPVDAALVALTVVAAAVATALRRHGLLPVLAAAELSLYAVGINPVAAPADLLPRPAAVEELERHVAEVDGGRVLGVGGVLPPNLASRYGLEDLRAYDPLRPLPFVALMRALGEPPTVLGGPLGSAPPRLVGAWSVRFLVAPPAYVAPGWERLWADSSASIWRNPRWLPGVRVVGRAVATGEAEGWRLLRSETLDLARVAVVPLGSPPVDAPSPSLVSVDATPGRVEVVTSCDGPCLVVVARPWAPGWRAEVDGRRAPLVRANLAGLGAVAPVGEHVVEIGYHPWRWMGAHGRQEPAQAGGEEEARRSR